MQEARTGRWSDEIERCSLGFQGERCAELHWRAVGGAYLCTAEYCANAHARWFARKGRPYNGNIVWFVRGPFIQLFSWRASDYHLW